MLIVDGNATKRELGGSGSDFSVLCDGSIESWTPRDLVFRDWSQSWLLGIASQIHCVLGHLALV